MESTGAWMARTGIDKWILKTERERAKCPHGLPNGCCVICEGERKAQQDIDDDPDDEPTMADSWEQEGTWSNLCQHGADIRDCPRCNPIEA